MPLAVIGAIVGEFVGSEHGLGHLILEANANASTDLLFAALIAISIACRDALPRWSRSPRSASGGGRCRRAAGHPAAQRKQDLHGRAARRRRSAPSTSTCRTGSSLSVLGPSGCGKSTLLRIIAGLIAADEGATVEVMGHAQNAPSDDVGVVFQTHNMLPWLTVEKNIRLAAEVRGLPAGEIDARGSEAVCRC